MYVGSLPAASINGTWIENIAVYAVDDEVLADLSTVDEITLALRDPVSQVEEMVITMSKGNITIPSPGIIQWRVEADHMRTLMIQTYEVSMTMDGEGDTVPLIEGTISIVGARR